MPFIKHTPIEEDGFCNDPEHNPPSMQVLAPGTHIYQCPNCGQLTTIKVPKIKF